MLTAKLARILRSLRRQHRLSLNQLAQLTGLSRRTLARLESSSPAADNARSGRGAAHPLCLSLRPSKPGGDPASTEQSRGEPSRRGLSRSTAFKLARFLLPPDQLQAALADLTCTSRAYALELGGSPEDYRLLDLLPDFYPAFLFHRAPADLRAEFEQHFAADYRNAFFRLLRLPERTLPGRLRAFRFTHDLTLTQTAALLGLSKSELHRLERGERRPSPRTRFRILRLLTLPLPSDSAPGSPRTRRRRRTDWLRCASVLLSLPPPEPLEFSDDPHCLQRLRYLWLTSGLSTRQLADSLGISPPHLIRLLRGDRRPSAALRRRLEALTASISSQGQT